MCLQNTCALPADALHKKNRYNFIEDAALVLNKDVEKHQGEQFIRPNGSWEFPCLFKAKHSRYMLVTEHDM
jgi:hypothetical protein